MRTKKHKMIRLTIITIILFTFSAIKGQDNIFQQLFPKTEGVNTVVVIRNCNGFNPPTENEIIAKYYFDKDGNNTTRYSVSENKYGGKQIYNYKTGKLISYQNYGTWSSTSNEGDFGMVWDSSRLTNEVKYQYEGDKINKAIWIDGKDGKISFEVEYFYNRYGEIKQEVTTSLPDITMQVKDTQKVESYRKDYKYTENTSIIKY